MTITYSKRAAYFSNEIAKKLLLLMEHKKTNLALSADITRKDEFIKLVKEIGPFICVLKTHIDIVEDFDSELISTLTELAKQYQFLIFEDRKFADIGNTVKLQYAHGIYHIAEWADIINAHSLPGPGLIEGLKQIGLPKGRALLLLAEMSSTQNLITSNYTSQTIELAKAHRDFVIGFIAQHRLVDQPDFLYFMPGVSSSAANDTLGQSYLSPEKAILDHGADIIIIGRDIYKSDNPANQAQLLQQRGWNAYLQRLTATTII